MDSMENMALQLEILRRQPRTLDGPPPKLQLSRLKDPMQCGYEASFKSLFNSMVGTVDTEQFMIDVMGNGNIGCDEKVFYVLRTLLISNVCYSVDFSQACTDLFTAIVLCGKDYISEGVLYEVLTGYAATTYEQQVLISAIQQLCFTDTEVLFEWRKIANCTRLYPHVNTAMLDYINGGEIKTASELHKLLKAKYKLAKDDAAFKEQLVSGIPNKEFIGALYMFHETNPSVMTVVEEDNGFMKGGA